MLFFVSKNKVELTEVSPVNQGEYNATELEFDFASSFDGLAKKAVITSLVTGKSYESPIVDNKCAIPYNVLEQKGTATVGVYAYSIDDDDDLELRYSPAPASFKVVDGSYREDVENPSDLTTSQAEILESQVQVEVDKLNDVVDSVEGKLANGLFNGSDGKNATIAVGKVETLNAGLAATVSNSGTETEAVLNFGIPRGETGAKGEQGEKGDTGPQGERGEKGEAGEDGYSPIITLEQTDSITATLSVTSKDSDGNITTKTATFGGSFTDFEEENF